MLTLTNLEAASDKQTAEAHQLCAVSTGWLHGPQSLLHARVVADLPGCPRAWARAKAPPAPTWALCSMGPAGRAAYAASCLPHWPLAPKLPCTPACRWWKWARAPHLGLQKQDCADQGRSSCRSRGRGSDAGSGARRRAPSNNRGRGCHNPAGAADPALHPVGSLAVALAVIRGTSWGASCGAGRTVT